MHIAALNGKRTEQRCVEDLPQRRYGIERSLLPWCGRNRLDSLAELRFVGPHPSVHDERTKWQERGDEDHKSTKDRPSRPHHGVQQSNAEHDEQQSMNQPDDAYGHGKACEILQRHRDADEQQKRGAFRQRDGSQKRDWIFHVAITSGQSFACSCDG